MCFVYVVSTYGHDNEFWLVDNYFERVPGKRNRGKNCHEKRGKRNDKEQGDFLDIRHRVYRSCY